MPSNRRIVQRPRRAPSDKVPNGIWLWLTDQPYDPLRDAGTGILETYRRPHQELWNAYRRVVLAWWVQHHPGTRPPLWWRFDAPGQRRRGESELAFLRRRGLLEPGELDG